MQQLIGLLALVGIIYISFLDWRRAVKTVLVISVLEGAIRKWLLPDVSDLIYFLKDIILFTVYINYSTFLIKKRKLKTKNKIINILIVLVSGWCIFQGLNPSLGSPIVGLFGLRGYIFYIPLMWIIPNLFQSKDELYNFLRYFLLLVIPVGLLGIAQFFSPASSPLNVYAPGEVADVATFGVTSATRVTGTFSYLSGYSVYLLFCFGLLIPLLNISQINLWRWLSIAELFLVIINAFMTGSRGVVIAIILFLVCYLMAKGLVQPTKVLRLIQKLIVPSVIVTLAAAIWFQPAIEAFWLRTTSNKDIPARIVGSFIEPFEFMQYKQIDGYGTGSTHQATPALRRVFDLPSGEFIPTYYESEMGRVALELGPIGFILWYGLRISLLVELWLVFCKLQRPCLQELALAAFLIHVLQLNGQLVFHHTFSVYYWFLSSFIFLLPRLEQIENWQQYLLKQNVPTAYFPDSPYQ
ncbi:MAG: hypothetical protein RIB93_04650 [Coleofasciculus sp. D1-CHI-01]|uniref:hypothetical protein n=1 Tax=Coleofasciculus sp. D1-CHI-01 TaxID=3068482 RepID=UPI0032FBE6CC